MPIALMGLNHTTAAVAVRERLAFSDTALAEALTGFRAPEVEELVILSTCNRVEFYMQGGDAEACIASCERFVADYHELTTEDFAPCLYRLYDLEAVRHLFRVAASLDSMVLGEPQILGQVKAAYSAARDAGAPARSFITCSSAPSTSARRRAAKRASATTRCRSATPRCSWPGRSSRICGSAPSWCSAPARPPSWRRVTSSARGCRGVRGQPHHGAGGKAGAEPCRQGHPLGGISRIPAHADIVVSSTSAPGVVITPPWCRTWFDAPRARHVLHRHRRAAGHRPGGQRPGERVSLRHRRARERGRGEPPRA